VTGKWAHAYETGLDAGVPFRDPAVKLWGTTNYRLFGEAREGALVGTDGWLYTSEEFETTDPVTDAREVQKKLTFVREVRDALAAQGAHLIVAVIPAKTRVYPEHLGAYKVPAVKAAVYEQFRESVTALGVPAPDCCRSCSSTRPRGTWFVRTDTHWTPLGAKIAAETLTKTVRETWPTLDLPEVSFRTTSSAAPQKTGDLLRYLPLPAGEGPQAAEVRVPRTTQVGESGGGLLGDAEVSVTLVGTSYSAIKDWNFEGALKEALHTDVLNAADPGKGPVVPMRAYLKSQALKDAPPKLVIWEIPERFLRFQYPEEGR